MVTFLLFLVPGLTIVKSLKKVSALLKIFTEK